MIFLQRHFSNVCVMFSAQRHFSNVCVMFSAQILGVRCAIKHYLMTV